MEVSGTIPMPMSFHTANIDEENGIMLIFGGLSNDDGIVYALDLNSWRWSRINNVQYKRTGHTSDLIGISLYLFGGDDGVHKNDVQKYDIK